MKHARAITLAATLALTACVAAPAPAPVCPPPPPSAFCSVASGVVAAGEGWLARHLLPAASEKLIQDLGRVVADECGSR